jgi:phosphoesterase RecJ-like protein
MKKKIEVLKEKIKKAKSIAISGHKNPDGDSLCSALALMELIRVNFKKEATVIYDGNLPRFLDRVPLRDRAVFHANVPEDSKYDLYILVDYGTRKNLGGVEKFVSESDFVIEFDHHFNEDVIGNLCFDDVEKAAAAQIIFDVARKAEFNFNKNITDLLTLGIITDTGNFKFVRHGDLFKDAADLVERGANMTELMNLLNNRDKKTVLAESKAVANAEFYMKGRLAVATMKHSEYRKLDGRGELVLSLLAQIRGVEFVVLLKEQRENQIGVSLRSRRTPINKIAESFGGGGHLCAAGAVMADSLENVHNKVISAFKGM